MGIERKTDDEAFQSVEFVADRRDSEELAEVVEDRLGKAAGMQTRAVAGCMPALADQAGDMVPDDWESARMLGR